MIAFIHIQKTAGQTVRALLRRHFGTRHCDLYDSVVMNEALWQWIGRCYPRLDSIGGHAVVPRGRFLSIPSGRFFTFLRDPRSRVLSHYQFLTKRGSIDTTFAEWASRNHDVQTLALAGEASAEKAIEILENRVGFCGVMEDFNRSLLLWRKWIGDASFDVSYRPVNVARSNDIRERVLGDPRNVEILELMNRLDQRVYAYARDTLLPRRIAEYGPALESDLAALEASLANARNLSFRSVAGRIKRNFVFRPKYKRLAARTA